MKDIFTTAVALILLVVLIVTLWNASSFLRNFGGSYNGFLAQSKIPIGDAKVPLQVPEAELWASTNPTLPGPSPYKGQVRIDPWDSDAFAEDAAEEYLSIRAAGVNTTAVRVANWSIESLVSDTRIPLPKAVLLYRLGEETGESDMYLAPGEYLYLVTGSSPLGESFHTNSCTGQLANYHAFYPRLGESCPAATTMLPATIENLRNMGEQCLEYISTLPTCELPRAETIKEDLLPACKAYILEHLSYNQCIDNEYTKNKYKVYNGGGWYAYLNQPRELWRNKYDIIRLLDAEGRVVDVYSY